MKVSVVFSVCLLLLHRSESKVAWINQEDESQCAIFSRFDYELKVVQKLGEFENLYKEQKKTNEELRAEIRNMKNEMKDHHLDTAPDTVIAFLAVLGTSISTGSGQIIVFEQAVTNIGQAYSSHTGVFTAPVDGLYQFTATLLTGHDKEIWCYVMLNGKSVARINERGTGGRHGSGSQTVILQLKEDITVAGEEPHGKYRSEAVKVFSESLIGPNVYVAKLLKLRRLAECLRETLL